MNRTLKNIISIIAVLWIICIVFLYFFEIQMVSHICSNTAIWCNNAYQIIYRTSHLYYRDVFSSLFQTLFNGKWNPVISITLIVSLIYSLFVWYTKRKKKKKKLTILLSPFYILLAFSLFFFIVSLRWFSFYDILREQAPYMNVFVRYPLILGALLFIVLLCASVGKKITNLVLEKEKDNVFISSFLFSFGLGAMAITGCLFILGLLDILQSSVVWSLTCLALIMSWREVWENSKKFFQKTIIFHSSFFGLPIALIFILFFFISHNVFELIRPMPIGFDDLGLYMNIPKLLSEGGTLISGINSYSWGLFMSLGYFLFHSTTITLFLSFLGGVLTLFSVYELIKKYCERRGMEEHKQTYALLMAALFYTLPSVVFQSAKDMKVDLAGMFFACLALICFLYRQENKEKKSRWLYMSALFLGFAFSIKYTFLLFISSLLIFIILTFIKEKKSIFSAIKTIIIFLVIFSIPFIPYGVKNVWETKEITMTSITQGKSEAPVIALDPPVTITAPAVTAPVNADLKNSYNSNDVALGTKGEIERYIGFDDGWEKYALLPFTVTFNTTESGMYVDIGYIFLAFLPCLFLVLLCLKRKEGKEKMMFINISVAGIIFWLLWGAVAKGIIWYGYAGFLFFFVWMVEILHTLRTQKMRVLSSLFTVVLGWWLITSVLLRSSYLPSYSIYIDEGGARYAMGIWNEEQYFENKIPVYVPITQTINADIEGHRENPPKVYRVGTFIKYFITGNNRVVLDDNSLDVFNTIYQEKDDKKTIQRFKNAGFKYLIIDTNTPSIDRTPEQIIAKRYGELVALVKNNPSVIRLVIDNPMYGIMFAEVL